MSKNSSPPPPDYAGAAEATAAGDLEAARYQTLANRPNSYYPGGQREWTQGTGETFDQAGYDQAMNAWNQQNGGSTLTQTQPPQFTGNAGPNNGEQDSSMMVNNRSSTGMSGAQFGQSTPAGPGVAPNRADFTTTENPDKWTERVTLSPEGQKAFESGERMNTGLAGIGENAVGQMGELFDTPFSIEGQSPTYQGATGNMPGFRGPQGEVPGYGGYRQNVVDAMMSRVNTDIGREKEMSNSNLAAQGIPKGSEAYDRAMEASDRKQVDAQNQAQINAEQMATMGYDATLAGRQQAGNEGMDRFGTGMDVRNQYNQEGMDQYNTGMSSRQQDISESLLQRQTPINELSAFRTGSQVNTPQFQDFGQQSFTGGPNYTGAANAQGQYDLGRSNQDIAQGNSMMGGMFKLGSAGIGVYPWSDRRLKKNLKRLGTSLMGFPVYAFDYIWGGGRQVGVMAQDVIKVIPEAVHTSDEGYMAVDYGMIR